MKPTKIELRKWLWFALFLFLMPGQAEGHSDRGVKAQDATRNRGYISDSAAFTIFTILGTYRR